jgi:hypothetical protein
MEQWSTNRNGFKCPKISEGGIGLPMGVTSMMFFFKLVNADIAQARRVVEQLRQRAIDLKWHPVGGIVHLTDHECGDSDRLPGKFLLIAAGDTVLAPQEVVLFEATPPGDEPRHFGLAAYAGYMEGSSQVVPTHLAGWQWIGVIRSDDMRAIKVFIHMAAELGLEVTASSAGKVLTASKDDTGQVRYEDGPTFPV